MGFSQILAEWRSSFYLALKTTIVGFLLALPWVFGYLLVVLAIQAYWNLILESYMIFIGFMSVIPPSPFVDVGLISLFGIPRSLPFHFGGSFSSIFSVLGEFNLHATLKMLFSLEVAFSFMVYVSFFAFFVRSFASESGKTVSWIRSYLIAAKSVLIGFIIGFVTLSLAFVSLFSMSVGEFWWVSPVRSSSDFAGFLLIVLFLAAFLLVTIGAAIYTPLAKFSVSEISESGEIGWVRSFVISLKASLVGILWVSVLLIIVVGIFAHTYWPDIMIRPHPFGIQKMGEFLLLTILLIIPATIASFVKYINEEMGSLKA